MPWIRMQFKQPFTPQTPFWVTVATFAISIALAWFKFILPNIQESRLIKEKMSQSKALILSPHQPDQCLRHPETTVPQE